ncbi:methenyltetrahydrofolate synthase domain-containing protein isoform X1 [Periophthalmus magnuspinnatus]|uniref:methenyltetrahydrofolate synthase domain-containing protein isoform X1 n=1 Tax=Periophthalmus magnuspinnatus TaxID=409849 RepID=UPI00145A038B|nr:methenyltetrahydrofolate synthase domain-containing protein isoform X1 [Periophthalmus magnuspinnatus]
MEPVLRTHPDATKEEIRQLVWHYIEENDLANFPRPVYNRIPNFKGASAACAKVSELQVFMKAGEIKVDPDKPLEGARLVILQAQKTLLVPTPRLRTGLFNKITPPPDATKKHLHICSSSQGVKDFSVPVSLDARMKVDLVIVGSVAVSEKGFRIGKGEGYADMEYGIMASMAAVNESTVVVTVVHDCQVVEIPERLIESHDLTVDYILTPTRVIKTDCQLPKPQGIIWSKLDKEKLEKIPILKKLRTLEEQTGKDVTLGEVLAKAESSQAKKPTTQRPRQNSHKDVEEEPKQAPKHEQGTVPQQRSRQRRARVTNANKEDGAGVSEGENPKAKAVATQREKGSEEPSGTLSSRPKIPDTVTSLYLGGIPPELRVSELKTMLREKGAVPLRLTWQGAQHRAFLDYTDPQAAEQALTALQDLSVKGCELQVELAKSQRKSRRGPHQSKRAQQESNTTNPEKQRSITDNKK